MAFVFQTATGFITIDSKPRQGIYAQVYTKDGYSKPVLLAPFSSTNYTATQDSQHLIHIVAENTKHQMVYIRYDHGTISRSILLDDPRQIYQFDHLHLFCTSSNIYFFYTVRHPSRNSRALVYQDISSTSPVQTLVSSIYDHCQIKFFTVDSGLYILYADFISDYELKLLSFYNEHSNIESLMHSSIPIVDYSLCNVHQELYLVIQKDAYGQQQLSFLNVPQRREYALSIQAPVTSPCLFSYCNLLWITYLSNDVLYVMSSNCDFTQFSVAVPSSSQNHLASCSYFSTSNVPFYATHLNIQLFPYLRIPVVCHFDLYGIHPDLPLATELDLLFEAMGFSYGHHLSQSILPTPSPKLIPSHSSVDLQSPPSHVPENNFSSYLFAAPQAQTLRTQTPLPDISVNSNSLKYMAKAFMDLPHNFDLPPNE